MADNAGVGIDEQTGQIKSETKDINKQVDITQEIVGRTDFTDAGSVLDSECFSLI